MSDHSSIVYTCCQDNVGVESVTIEVDLADCSFMSLGLFDRLRSVDVPESKRPVFASTDNQRIVPFEVHTGVSVAFEESIHTLMGVQVPDEQRGVIRRTDCYVVLVNLHFRDGSTMTSSDLLDTYLCPSSSVALIAFGSQRQSFESIPPLKTLPSAVYAQVATQSVCPALFPYSCLLCFPEDTLYSLRA